jgi:hypothetical protein
MAFLDRVYPEAICFEHKNTKTHLSCPQKGTFSCFDVQAKVSGWLAHQNKTQLFPAGRE